MKKSGEKGLRAAYAIAKKEDRQEAVSNVKDELLAKMVDAEDGTLMQQQIRVHFSLLFLLALSYRILL